MNRHIKFVFDSRVERHSRVQFRSRIGDELDNVNGNDDDSQQEIIESEEVDDGQFSFPDVVVRKWGKEHCQQEGNGN